MNEDEEYYYEEETPAVKERPGAKKMRATYDRI